MAIQNGAENGVGNDVGNGVANGGWKRVLEKPQFGLRIFGYTHKSAFCE
jgi:hypothetical protein